MTDDIPIGFVNLCASPATAWDNSAIWDPTLPPGTVIRGVWTITTTIASDTTYAHVTITSSPPPDPEPLNYFGFATTFAEPTSWKPTPPWDRDPYAEEIDMHLWPLYEAAARLSPEGLSAALEKAIARQRRRRGRLQGLFDDIT